MMEPTSVCVRLLVFLAYISILATTFFPTRTDARVQLLHFQVSPFSPTPLPSPEKFPPFYIVSPSPAPNPPEYSPNPPMYQPPAAVNPPPSAPAQPPPEVVNPPPSAPAPPHREPQSGAWCVAKPAVPDPIVKEAMDYACGSGADCKSVQPDGPCFQPNTMFAHASYAFNSYWQNSKVGGGTCDFGGTAMIVTVDPSFEDCHFICNN